MPDDRTSAILGSMPFAEVLGIEEVTAEPSRVTGSMAWEPGRCTSGGVLHGGALMGFADTLGAVCAFLNLPDGATSTATIESKTNFLRPVRGGRLRAVARPLYVGRMVIVVDTELRDDEEELVARLTQTQAVLRG